MKRTTLLLTLLFMFFTGRAQDQSANPNSIIRNSTISGEWFLGFGYNDGTEISQVNLKRGYLTVKSRLNDIYLEIDLKRNELLRNTYFELGLVHRPWIHFEQKLTGYRVQGKINPWRVSYPQLKVCSVWEVRQI